MRHCELSIVGVRRKLVKQAPTLLVGGADLFLHFRSAPGISLLGDWRQCLGVHVAMRMIVLDLNPHPERRQRAALGGYCMMHDLSLGAER